MFSQPKIKELETKLVQLAHAENKRKQLLQKLELKIKENKIKIKK
jgi:hypothetical protein